MSLGPLTAVVALTTAAGQIERAAVAGLPASDFGATYGPLTGVMALLLWANLTGISTVWVAAASTVFDVQPPATPPGAILPGHPRRWTCA